METLGILLAGFVVGFGFCLLLNAAVMRRGVIALDRTLVCLKMLIRERQAQMNNSNIPRVRFEQPSGLRYVVLSEDDLIHLDHKTEVVQGTIGSVRAVQRWNVPPNPEIDYLEN